VILHEQNDAAGSTDGSLFIPNTFSISRFGEHYLSGVNRHTFESVDSKSLYDRNFKVSFSVKETLNIVIGLDSGLLANYVLNLDIPEGTRFLFVELDEIIELLNVDIPESHKHKVSVCKKSDFLNLLDTEDYEVYLLKNRTSLYSSTAVTLGHIEQYLDLFNEIEKEIVDRKTNHEIDFSQKIFTKVQLQNVSQMLNSASLLRSAFSGKTAVIVGGGPSMTEHLTWIKENRDILIVIAVSRITHQLIKHNIIPDFAVSVDPQDNSFIINREMMQHYKMVTLVYSYHICPRIINQWRGKSLYLGDRFPWKDEGNIPVIGPTVSNSALRLAIEMGCQQIILSGVDLCYSTTGVTHAKGTIEAKLGPNLGLICEWVDTYSGHKAETPMPLVLAIQSFESEVSNYHDIEFINLSKSAAKIGGVKYCAFDEVEVLGDKINVSDVISSLPILSDRESMTSYLNSLVVEFESKRKTFGYIIEKLNLIILLVDKMKSAGDVKVILSCTKKMERIEKELNKKFPETISMIRRFGYFEFSRSLVEKDSSEWCQDTVNQMHEGYFSAYHSVAKNIVGIFNDTLERVRIRLSELNLDADIDELSAQWLKDNQPGRVLIWKDFNSKNLSSINLDKGKISDLENMYEQQLIGDVPAYVDRINNIHGVNAAFIKVSYLVKTKNILGLEYLISSLLSLMGTSTEIDRLYYFSNAKRLELEKNFSEALNVILKVPEEILTENEMKLIIKLSLITQELDVSEKFLKKLLSITAEYMPQYAHLLRLRGSINEAINVYLDYLEQYSEDIVTWVKLGQFMVDIEQYEFAKMAFNNVIDKDNSNKVANDFFTRYMSNT
jgi:hypothetical protein